MVQKILGKGYVKRNSLLSSAKTQKKRLKKVPAAASEKITKNRQKAKKNTKNRQSTKNRQFQFLFIFFPTKNRQTDQK